MLKREMEEHDGRRPQPLVVLTSSPFHGHMTPTLQLATTLHANGFPIAIAHSNLNPPNPSNHPSDFTFLPLSDNLSAVEGTGGFAKFINTLNNNCKGSFKEHLTRLVNEGNKSIVVIYDNIMYFAGVVADDLNLPRIMFRTTSAAFIPALLLRQQVRQHGRFLEEDFVMQEVVPNQNLLRYKDLPFSKTPIEDWKQNVANYSQQAHPSALICNTIKFLEHESLTQVHNMLQVPVFAVGPLHKLAPNLSSGSCQEDTSCITWLDKQPPKSVVYISFGSLATMETKMLIEMAWGLAKSNQRFLWVVRPGSVSGSEWLELLPEGFIEETRERGFIVKWAPQKEVLAHFAVGGFWSHCGWNSCLESISSGVVMICQPFIVDQMVNARYVSYVWKIGLELEWVERGEVERMIRRVMVDEEGVEMRVRVNDMKEMVKEAVGDDGSSQKSLEDLVDFILSC
ncbi:putative UDP-glucuronosyl/UDP-glucosyltransferase [Helianthus annuus]|uniref:Putative UDP-glucosyl transferase 76E1 n=1 Tax=Helianthus annuus TaxID=4232 RepID=A0A251U8Q6_HELAN|nr:UDP-glycosyltransferase 76H1 [Helianthus annuus]KAF5797218.1 putative UDP-glucuronosyl/UDP-glucosyltransferase [Helianthus annuus]KAJ0548961.1 putative UDP-glucuronosyl/UDP-glucosyltransferase [Helianthus annuus]KAJ0555175.1 putative UDP-glucuronosyl/UDP-glucosyltransferase [Helianthus annuus]KAJ0903374.1 putative UDP-glucuronosyl/UDP-glucosyltransferase [Helianthus annuus]